MDIERHSMENSDSLFEARSWENQTSAGNRMRLDLHLHHRQKLTQDRSKIQT